jgi:UDP-N-acetylglucosamine:LPS N-acetylglucosamine transferase
MDLAYAVADLVVARAGAISVSELCLVQKPAILVPLPTAAEDHQTHNARALTDRGAAVLLRDADTVEQLGSLVHLTHHGPESPWTACARPSQEWEPTMQRRPSLRRSSDWHDHEHVERT